MDFERQRHDPLRNLVGFYVGEVHYAVSIAVVREIVNPLRLVELPSAPHSIAGVADYRGDVVPIVDLRVRFSLPPEMSARRAKWILIDVGGWLVALVVDRVTDVFGTGTSGLRPSPSLGGGEDVRGIAGVCGYDGHLVFILDTTRFADVTRPLLNDGSIGIPASRQGGV